MRRAAITTLVALSFVGVTGPVLAQPTEVDPDRPSVANSARTVPPGAVQVETGVEYSLTSRAASPTERQSLVEVVARAGVVERLEVQIGWEPLVHLRGPEDETGTGDVTLALKYRAFDPPKESPWPAFGLQPVVKFPVAHEPIGSERPDFGVLGLASLELPAGFGLDVNAGIAAIGQRRPSGYRLQALTSAALALEVGAFSPFVEVFYASRDERDGRDRVGVDAGIVYRATKRVALDAAIETSLSGVGPDWAVRAGVSVRLEPGR